MGNWGEKKTLLIGVIAPLITGFLGPPGWGLDVFFFSSNQKSLEQVVFFLKMSKGGGGDFVLFFD